MDPLKIINQFFSLSPTSNYKQQQAVLQKPDHLYYLYAGTVALYCKAKGEKESILDIVTAPSFLGEGLPKTPSQERYQLQWRVHSSQAELTAIPIDLFLRMIKTHPEAGWICCKTLIARIATLLSRLSKQRFMDVTERILDRLSQLAASREAVTHPDGIQIRCTRDELGKWAGCSRETAGRTLKLLATQKILFAHGKSILLYR